MSWGFDDSRLAMIDSELCLLADDVDATLSDIQNNLKEIFNNVSVTEFAPGIRMISAGDYPAGRRINLSADIVNKFFNNAAANANAKRIADIEEGFARLSNLLCRQALLKKERDLILNGFAA